MPRFAGLETAVLSICLMTLWGCSSMGPDRVQAGRGLYNVAVAKTNDEQLLLNIVRLRFLDTPFFLQVSSISTNFTFEGSALAGGTLNSTPSTASLGVAGRVVASPTVTYTPLHGDQFSKRLLSPIELSTVLLLTNSGWSVERVFRLCVRSINGVLNAPSASGPTPKDAPVFNDFLRVTRLLRVLQKRSALSLAHTDGGAKDRKLVVEIASEALDSPELLELTELLGLTPGRRRYHIENKATKHPETIGIVTRSLMGSLFYVSHGVDVTDEDNALGRIRVTRTPDGEEFDWSLLSRGLLKIRSHDDEPEDAATRIPYRGSWFYIADSDFDSKATFTLLAQLFALSAGDVPSTAPILTLPVGIGSVR
jgi:hypothetical protein